MTIEWSRFGGYECSSKGDARFSAFNARMPDGRTIEQWYQCDIKGYDPGGTNWRLGKGNKPILNMSIDIQWDLYLSLWKIWAVTNPHLMRELVRLARQHGVLSDRFATSEINQARALATLVNEWC